MLTSRTHPMEARELSVAAFSRKLCIGICEHVETRTMSLLIPLSKIPDDVRSVGIGELVGRVVGVS